MSDKANANTPPNSSRSTTAQAQDFHNTPSLTLPLIPSPRQDIEETYNTPCDLKSDFDKSIMYL